MENSFIIKNFEKQAEIFSQRTAVTFGEENITYHDLNEKVNILANFLIDSGVGRNSLVAVVLSRSIDFIMAVLAIIKAGACYVPVDPELPAERIDTIIKDSGVSLLITNLGITHTFNMNSDKVICINTFQNMLPNLCKKNPNVKVNAEDPIYVIYTSGSTGVPKGAINSYAGFNNLIEWYIEEFSMNQNDRIYIYTSLSFDLTQKNIFAPLVVGARLFLYEENLYDPELIVEKIKKHKATWINSTPSSFYPLTENSCNLKRLKSLRYVLLGGEPLFAKRVLSIRRANPNLNIINTYGPTECADVCAFYPLQEKDFESTNLYVPIGKAIKNMQLYVFNDQMQEVALGEIGELYVTGRGVGLGYLNKSELTKQSFLLHINRENREVIFYKTGDLVRRLIDFNIEFVERKDFQVKMRGYRVELEEISNVLKTYAYVTDALVIAADGGSDDKYLIAYVVAADGKSDSLDELDIKRYLETFLPSYMIPAAILVIDCFPLTLNGKIDRKKLPLIDSIPSSFFNKNLSITEEKLLVIWKNMLPQKINNPNDSFFLLGGHSLSAIRLIFKIREEFSVVISIYDLFKNATLSLLAKLIDEKKGFTPNQIVNIEKSYINNQKYPLSFPHQRIWYITQTFTNPLIFNNLVSLSFKGYLDIKRFEQAFNMLIDRHEIFRTCIDVYESKTYEKICDTFKFTLEILDFSAYCNEEQLIKVEKIAKSIVSTSFDMTQLPFFRARLIKLNQQHHVFIVCLHQFLVDGASMDVFYSELSSFYNNTSICMEPLPIQYKDYALWQEREIIEKKIDSQIKFWQDALSNAPEKINLPLDKQRKDEFSYEGKVHTTYVSLESIKHVVEKYEKLNATIFMVLLSAYAVLLFNYSKDQDIVIGSPIASRNDPKLSGLIGFFVNLIPYRIRLNDDLSFMDLVASVKEFALNAYMNQDVPFINLPYYLGVRKNKAYHPIFQTVFAMQPYAVDNLQLEGVKVIDLDYEEPIAKFDIALNASIKKEGLELKFEYATDLFLHTTIEKMAKEYKNIIEQVNVCPHKKIIEIISSFN